VANRIFVRPAAGVGAGVHAATASVAKSTLRRLGGSRWVRAGEVIMGMMD
jgi:hypothetical protein